MKMCLIVDDSRVVRVMAQKIVRELDFETMEAADGAEALEICRKKMPDAILLDRNMPTMDGIEFLRKLRSTSGGNVPRVILCTTEAGIEQIQEALEAGADEYIMKPFDSEIIRGKFAQAGLL